MGRWVVVAAGVLAACAGDAGDDAAQTGGGTQDGSSASTDTSGVPGSTGALDSSGSDSTGTRVACEAEPGEWVHAPPLPLGPRQENGTTELLGTVAVMGGYENINVAFATTIELFDPETALWEQGIPLDEELHHPNFAAADGRLFIAGFLRGVDWLSDGRVFEYVPDTGWVERAPMPGGTERGAGGAVAVDDLIYVAGGARSGAAGGGPVRDFSAYDPAADAWTALPPMPTARHHLAAAAVDGIIYAVGGRELGFDTPVDNVESFDLARGEWSVLQPLPKPRGGLAVAAVDGCVYAIGGEGNPDSPRGMFDDNDVYDPASDTWTALAPMPLARHGTHAAVVDGWIYIPGGGEAQGQNAAAHMQVFIPHP